MVPDGQALHFWDNSIGSIVQGRNIPVVVDPRFECQVHSGLVVGMAQDRVLETQI